MPYIKKSERIKFEKLIEESVEALAQDGYSPGSLNYYFSSIIWKIFKKNRNYSTANALIGALENIKIEFYRREVEGYENEKIETNGDI